MSGKESSYGIYGDPEGDSPFTVQPIGFIQRDINGRGRDNYGGDLFGDPGAFTGQGDALKLHPNDMSHRKITEAQRRGFHRDAVLPEVSEGMQLAKVSGEPAVIPVAGDEPKVEGSAFTQTQLHAIGEIVEEKRQTRIASKGEIFRSDIYFG